MACDLRTYELEKATGVMCSCAFTGKSDYCPIHDPRCHGELVEAVVENNEDVEYKIETAVAEAVEEAEKDWNADKADLEERIDEVQKKADDNHKEAAQIQGALEDLTAAVEAAMAGGPAKALMMALKAAQDTIKAL